MKPLIGILGSDNRQETLFSLFQKEPAFQTVYHPEPKDFSQYSSLILPIPAVSKDQLICDRSEVQYEPGDLDEAIGAGCLIIGGKCPRSGWVDVCKRDDFSYYNAVLTAEGAVALIIQETPFGLWKRKCLITGFGRVAQVLADRLKGFGCRICIAARKAGARANAESLGYEAMDISELSDRVGDFDIILNTVEAQLFFPSVLSKFRKKAYFMELASHQAGLCPNDLTENTGFVYRNAPGLPGKISPLSAAEVYQQTIENVWKESHLIF